MVTSETVFDRTDEILNVLMSETRDTHASTHHAAGSLWNAGLMAAPLFAVGDDPQPSADREARKLVEQHLAGTAERQHVATAQLLEFQYSLQMRSKVISAIERLMQP